MELARRAPTVPKRLLYAVCGLIYLAFTIEGALKGRFVKPIEIVALIGQAWLAGLFFLWSFRGSPNDRNPDDTGTKTLGIRRPKQVLLALALTLAIVVFNMLRH